MATKKTDKEIAKASRRGFLRAATVGVAGVALTGRKAEASAPTTPPPKAAPSAPARVQLTPAEQAKDVKMQDAARILKDIDNNIEIQWVKGKAPASRRVIQMYG